MLTGLVNRRKANRIPFHDEVNILLESNGRALTLATATNISGGGIQFHVPRGLLRLQPGETIDLIFNIPKFGETVITGEIRYLLDGIDNDGQPVSYFGVQFLNINEALLKGLEIFCTGPILDSPPAAEHGQSDGQSAAALTQLLEKVRSLPNNGDLIRYLLDNNDPEKALTQGSIDYLVQLLLDAQRVRQSLAVNPDPAKPSPIYRRVADGAAGPLSAEQIEQSHQDSFAAESSLTETAALNPSIEDFGGESPYQSLVDQLVQSMNGVATDSAPLQPSAGSLAPSDQAEPLSNASSPEPEAPLPGPAVFGSGISPIPADNELLANEGRFPAAAAPDSNNPGNQPTAVPGGKEAVDSTEQQSIDQLVRMLLTQNQSKSHPIPQSGLLPESAPEPEIAPGETAGEDPSSSGEPAASTLPLPGYSGQFLSGDEAPQVNEADFLTPGLNLAGNVSSTGTPLPSLPPLFEAGPPLESGLDPVSSVAGGQPVTGFSSFFESENSETRPELDRASGPALPPAEPENPVPDAIETGAIPVVAEPNGSRPEIAGSEFNAPETREAAVNPATAENIPGSGTCNAQIQFKEGKSVAVMIEDLNIGGVTVRLNELIPEKSHVNIHFSGEGYLISNVTAICDWSGRYRGGDYLAGFIFGQLTFEQSTQLRSLIQKFNY